MANCPKCGYKLRIWDVKADCPECGVNLVYFNQQERLAADADKAEEEYIKLQPKIDRVKFAFVGTKLSIVRLILLFVPIGMLFLPLVHIKANIPFNSIDSDISILNLAMDVVAKMQFGILSVVPMSAVICYFVAILSIFIAAIFGILNIPFVSVSCSPKGFKRNVKLSSCGIVFTVISIIAFLVLNGQLSNQFGDMYSGNLSFGAFLVIVGFVAIIVVNVLIKKQDAPVKYKDISEYVERIAQRKIEIAEMEAQAEAIRKEYREKQKAASTAK